MPSTPQAYNAINADGLDGAEGTNGCTLSGTPKGTPPVQQVMAPSEGLKPCCACPETRRARDDCMLLRGSEEECATYIRTHQECLRSYGFKV